MANFPAGVHRVKPRKSHYSTRSFGAAAAPIDYTPFNLDAGFGFPDQVADGEPQGCTWYSQTELAQDLDRTRYDRSYTRKKTLEIAGQQDGPCYMEDSLSAVCVYGVKKPDEPESDADENRFGRYFMLEREPGLDWFDSAIAVMRKTGCPLSIASPWFPAFQAPRLGVLPSDFPTTWPSGVPGHDHKVHGLAYANHELVLLDKSWQGTRYGNGGEAYWTRDAFNRLMDIPGSAAFLIAKWDGSITTIQWAMLYRLRILVRFYQRLIARGV